MKQKLPLYVARTIANFAIADLEQYCQRIEIAGSVRREKSEVGDIELIAIPKFQADMFGGALDYHALDLVDWSKFGNVIKSGHKYKQIELKEGVNLDLFIVTPPAQFGVQFIIRTGPAEYSRCFVTPRKFGGMLPSNMKVKDGAVWLGDKMYETPEEADVYKLIGAQWIEPKARTEPSR